jgi:hypothetical protein
MDWLVTAVVFYFGFVISCHFSWHPAPSDRLPSAQELRNINSALKSARQEAEKARKEMLDNWNRTKRMGELFHSYTIG